MTIRLQHVRDALDRFNRDYPPGHHDPMIRSRLLLVAARIAMAAPLPVVH
ncbi:MAG TPA: hypothetical protein VD978_31485 [Azospirillum sp.]|nr:hypothetical protein [Azospirillum sp.]